MNQSTKPHVQKLLERLEAVSSHLEEKFKDAPNALGLIAKSKGYTEAYIQAYEDGKLLFDREVLADVRDQIERIESGRNQNADDCVKFVDVIGRVKHESLSRSFRDEEFIKPKIIYRDYQSLTHMSLNNVDKLLYLDMPIGLGYTAMPQTSGWSLCDLQNAFCTQQEAWLQSSICKSLVQLLESVEMPVPIHKIVSFGLGSLDSLEKKTTYADLLSDVHRSATQHAAALTMARVLGTRKADGQPLPCYVQDPIYNKIEKDMLASMGFMVVEDPSGFLELDEHTLVFSVTPNVPVRQIVADIQWPAAMVWNEVLPERPDEWDRDYEEEEMFGQKHLVSPWSTDEPSSRVREMVKHYNHFPFPKDDNDDSFGELGIYFKR